MIEEKSVEKTKMDEKNSEIYLQDNIIYPPKLEVIYHLKDSRFCKQGTTFKFVGKSILQLEYFDLSSGIVKMIEVSIISGGST